MVSGRKFRETLHKPLPGAPKQKKCRVVPAFTMQSLQKGICLLPPPSCNPYKENLPSKESMFRSTYSRGELPVALDAKRRSIIWKVDINKIDYCYYLPIFFEGLIEVQEPYRFMAQQGIDDLLNKGGAKLFPVVPQLILPMKNALRTKNKKVMCTTLRVLQQLIKAYPLIGEALVPYYRQLLPTLSLFKEKNVNCGDRIDNTQLKGENLADAINETLVIMEEYGGEDAFINIKYMMPTYESAVQN